MEQEIETIIENIMIKDGPDGHCDGADIIREFIMDLLHNIDKPEVFKKWKEKYPNNKRSWDL